MSEKLVSKTITNKEDINFLLNITEDDMTLSFFMDCIAEFDGKTRFNPWDKITIPKGMYGVDGCRNSEPINTTVGIWFFNKYFLERDFSKLVGYANETIDDDTFGSIDKIIATALLEDKIELEKFKRFELKTQKIMPLVSVLSSNHSEKLLTCTSVINKKKDELFKKYAKEVEKGDPAIGIKIEQELLAFAIDYMGDDPAMDLFISGSRSSLKNHFKNMYVMKGVVKDPDPNAKQKYHIAKSNYMDGISAGEYALFANSLAAGPFSRSKKTEFGGYLEKLFLYALQHLKVDKEGSDCGTKRYITVKLTNKNKGVWMYSYVIQGTKLIELTSDNIDQYINKTVKLRFAGLCEDKKKGCICSKCFGNLPYRRGITNIGIELTQVASTMKNKAMKAFHDSVETMHEIDLNKMFCS